MQALSQLSYSPTKAGTLRGGQNPVKALISSYYAFEIIGLASTVRSESGTGLTSSFTRPDCKPSRSICTIPPFTQPSYDQRFPTSSHSENDLINVATRASRAADEAPLGFQPE